MTPMKKIGRLCNKLLLRDKPPRQKCLFPPGHFYSPIADLNDISERQESIWCQRIAMPGIDWNEEFQLWLLPKFAPYITEINFPNEANGDIRQYFYANDQYPALDAEVLFCILRHFIPSRVIEVGSGFSSLITAQVNRDFLGNEMEFTCIEPYPRGCLQQPIYGLSQLIQRKVEDIPPEFFLSLGKNDVLFIDSSHVSKIGSDVNHLFFEIIPRLQRGVLVHIHDIFLPDEYPKEWMIHEGRHWNEQYLVRAFLQFNSDFEVIWASHFMATRHRDLIAETFPRFPEFGAGGSLWLRRK